MEKQAKPQETKEEPKVEEKTEEVKPEVELSDEEKSFKSFAYSKAAFGSCIEQGPTTTITLSSCLCNIWLILLLAPKINFEDSLSNGISLVISSGVESSSLERILLLSVIYIILLKQSCKFYIIEAKVSL